MLVGDIRTLELLDAILSKELKQIPNKKECESRAFSKVYKIGNGSGDSYTLRLFLDDRSKQGTLKVRKNDKKGNGPVSYWSAFLLFQTTIFVMSQMGIDSVSTL